MSRDPKSLDTEDDDDPIRHFVEQLARYAARCEFRRLMQELEDDAGRGNSGDKKPQR